VIKETIINASNQTATSSLESIIYQLSTFFPPYYYTTSPLIEKYHKGGRSSSNYLTRPDLLHRITTQLLTQPFLLDALSDQTVSQLVIQLPLKDILETVSKLFLNDRQVLDDMAVVGLLMNITKMGDVESGKYLNDVLTQYAKAVQLLLTHLPVSYLADPTVNNNNDIMNDGKLRYIYI
jgi:hypothetical protein